MSRPDYLPEESLAGTARLPVVVLVALTSFFTTAILEYSLPLYFELAGFPAKAWADLNAWQVAPWFFAPVLAGLLARRFGERRVWGAALAGQAVVPALFAIAPYRWIIAPAAFWNGFTGTLMWIGGISLAQVVPPRRKGLSNGLLMMSLGLGSVVGPLAGRAILWHEEVSGLAAEGNWKEVGWFLVNVRKPEANPSLAGFYVILWGVVSLTAVCAVVMFLWGQRPGRWGGETAQHGWDETVRDLQRLWLNPRFWALVVALCLFGGSIFQASNQFLVYRAKDVQLIAGSQDRGWILLQLLKTLMWIPGGLAVGLLAGRRAPGLAGVLMLAAFALAAAGIGASSTQVELFVAVAGFEFVRQFMRWSHAGYLSEHMPPDLRATAIGCAITVAGLSSTIFGFIPLAVFNPDAPSFDSRQPFWVASNLGCVGALGLLIFDRFVPIRQAELPADKSSGLVDPVAAQAGPMAEDLAS
jgi:MFS family permease